MSESSLGTALDGADSRALSCVTALRIGGGLYILADADGRGDLYYQVDAGVRAGLRSCEGRRLNADVVRIAKKACQRLTSTFSGDEQTRQFTLAGFSLLADVLALLDADISEPAEGHMAIFEKALEVASAWSEAVRIDGHGSLQEFELSCQRESVSLLREGGVLGLRNALGPMELSYRGLAKGVA
ncbi:hypothetical protein [Streptacidiphilus sp. P02-A3a]|uniref:hypothetical protein n=1 Tax=Streptacidiphilus sp. P02-A3a TaxID=2704468 RepID=UPI0015FC8CDF|nr:hypothetical protein [Streptacidiphilus sp. P02-A3a]QMU68364.1 hypothetical protein GXP74_09115 [Streptacidiphilus sp. P02-A3a]